MEKMNAIEIARAKSVELTKNIIMNSDRLDSEAKDDLIDNLILSAGIYNRYDSKNKIAGCSEDNIDSLSEYKLDEIDPNQVEMDIENVPTQHRQALVKAYEKAGVEYSETVKFKISKNLNIGVMCSGQNKEGYAPIVTSSNTKSKAHKSALLGDSLDGGGLSQFGDANTPIYGQETPGLLPFETMLVDPQVIEQAFVPGVVEKVIGHKKVYPNTSIKVVYFNNIQFMWSFREYDSLSRDGISDFNRSVLKAFNYKFMGNVIFNDFDQEEWGQAKIQAFALRNKARKTGWKQYLNSMRRFGWRGGQGQLLVRGMDNAIGRLPTIFATPNNDSSPYSDPQGRVYQQFREDFAVMWTVLQTRTNMLRLGKSRDDLVADGRVKLVMFPNQIIYLATAMNPTTQTTSALTWLIETFPKMEIILDKTLDATATEAGSQVKAIWTTPGNPQGFRMQLIMENEKHFGCPTLLATSSTEIKSFRPEILGDGSTINYKDMYQPGDVMLFVPALLVDFEYAIDQSSVEKVYKTKNLKIDMNSVIAERLKADKAAKAEKSKLNESIESKTEKKDDVNDNDGSDNSGENGENTEGNTEVPSGEGIEVII